MEDNGKTALARLDASSLVEGQEVEFNTIDRERVGLTLKIVKQLASTKAGVVVSDTEALMFIHTCRTYGFNPYLRQAFLIKYDSSKPAQIVIAADSYIRIADGQKDYGGYEVGWIVTDQQGKARRCIKCGNGVPDGMTVMGAYCQVFRDNRRTPVIEVLRKEVDKQQSSWNTQPETMTMKCAIARAHRRVYPDLLGSLYSEDEMPGRNVDREFADTGKAEVEKRDERTGADDARTIKQAQGALYTAFMAAVDAVSPEMLDATRGRMFPDVVAKINKEWKDRLGEMKIDDCDKAADWIIDHGIPTDILGKYDPSKKEPEGDEGELFDAKEEDK